MSLTQTMPILINQTVAMFLMMGMGFVLFRAKLLTNDGSRQLATIALYVAGAAVVIRALAIPYDADHLVGAGICALLTVVFTLGSALIGRLVYRDRGRICQLAIMISNMGFVGIPLVQSVLGEEYVFYISMCIAAQVPITWTYGVWLASNDLATISPRKIFTNPAVIAVFVGIFLFLTSTQLPDVVASTVDGLADLNVGIAMLVLGCYLAQADLRALLKTRSMYLTAALRLVAVPALIIAILALVPFDPVVKMTLLIGFSAPAGTTSAIFPQMFGADYKYGAGLVSLTTLLSIVTMPAVLACGVMLL